MRLCKKPPAFHLAAGTAKKYSFQIAILIDFAKQNQSKWRSEKFSFAATGGGILFTQPQERFETFYATPHNIRQFSLFVQRELVE
jgi:hypothetical protein